MTVPGGLFAQGAASRRRRASGQSERSKRATRFSRGTSGSNPLCSGGESGANLISGRILSPSAVGAPDRSDYHFQIRTGIFCSRKEAVAASAHVFTFKNICFCIDEIRALLVPDRQVSRAEEPRGIVVGGCPTSWTPGCHAFLGRIYHWRVSIFGICRLPPPNPAR